MNAMKAMCIAACMSAVCCNAERVPSRSLLDAIARVESTDGKASGNVYQITPEYVADVNRIQRKLTRVDGVRRHRFSCEDVFDRAKSEEMMLVYWGYYSRRLGKTDAEHFAKLHNVGYRGVKEKRSAGERYWNKVKNEMNAR